MDHEQALRTERRALRRQPRAATRRGEAALPAPPSASANQQLADGGHHALMAAMGGSPDAPPELRQALSPERLRYECEQAWFNDVFLLAPLAYFVLAFDSTILQANLVGAELLGIGRDGQGAAFRRFVCARFWPDFDRFLGQALNSARPLRVQLQMCRSPEQQGFQVTLQASADASGQALRLMLEPAAGRLEALERGEERWRRAVHSADEGIWEIDASARTSFVNPKMAQLLGYRIEEMLEQPLLGFMDEEGRALLERNIARRLQGAPEQHEFKFLRKDGTELWVTLATNPIFDGAGQYLGALALVSDITERKRSSERMWLQANFDTLTALPNRHLFLDRLANALRKAGRERSLLALLFIDLDEFKQVNDRLGHEQGDALLAEASRRIVACVRSTDTVARLGGDEFTVILPGLDTLACVERVAQQAVAALARPFGLAGGPVQVSASIGIALYPDDATEIAALLRQADRAMYAAKGAGRNRYCYFTADLQQAAQLRLRTTDELRQALVDGQFELLYQPIVHLASGAVRRAEALLRWRHPQRGLLAPAQFLADAEASGLIVEIGDWVFRQAARQVGHWQRQIDARFQIGVNTSGIELRGDGTVAEGWGDCLKRLALPPSSIAVEINEGALLDGAAGPLQRLARLRALGLQVALDHFGTGYSSLSHLTRFGIDLLKIDSSLVRGLEHDAGSVALCEAIIAMAHKLGLEVVAQGVESASQRALLAAAGCDYAQGYLFAAAMPAAQFGMAAPP